MVGLRVWEKKEMEEEGRASEEEIGDVLEDMTEGMLNSSVSWKERAGTKGTGVSGRDLASGVGETDKI